MATNTMTDISYGMSRPQDLLEKLKHDGNKVGANLHKYDLFNFFVTAAVLNEWIRKYYSDVITPELRLALCGENVEELPIESSSWVVDKECLPNKGCDVRLHISDVMRICWGTANASKHHHWRSSSGISAIEENPQIKDWYQYFFTSTAAGIYIEIDSRYYTVYQVKMILTQFYDGLLTFLDALESGTNSIP
jgi:hypothetical protein